MSDLYHLKPFKSSAHPYLISQSTALPPEQIIRVFFSVFATRPLATFPLGWPPAFCFHCQMKTNCENSACTLFVFHFLVRQLDDGVTGSVIMYECVSM